MILDKNDLTILQMLFGIYLNCNHDKYPEGKIIDPSDRYARRTDKGDYKCGICVNEESKKLIDKMNRTKGVFS